jgi:UDP-glucuronate decarboxylase
VYGDGGQTRSFCYVDDLVAGLIALMDSSDDVTGPINLGNPEEHTMLELAQAIIDLTGSPSRIVHQPLPSDDPLQRRPDIGRATSLLDWAPHVALREGLAHTIGYFDALLTARGRAVVATRPPTGATRGARPAARA